MPFQRKSLIILLLLGMIAIPITTFAQESSWPTFSKDQQRTGESIKQVTQPPLYLKWTAKNIGWSISQPIVVGNYIYHQAGGYLYKIPLNLPFDRKSYTTKSFLSKGVKRVKISNDYNARSHPVYDSKTNRLYVGTGDYRIRRINPSTMKIEVSYDADGRLVDAPTLLGKELIAYGTSSATLYIRKANYVLRHKLSNDSSMVITGTFAVKESKNPIIFIPINYRGQNRSGFVDAYRIIDNGNGKAPSYKYVWSKPFKTDNGVPTSAVYDKSKDRVYFTDKSGAVYAVNASTGKLVWKNTTYRSKSSATTLINNSPALSGNTLVVPFRYQDGRNHGMIAAFDTRNGKLLWARTSSGNNRKTTKKYDGEIATNPVIDKPGSGVPIVLIGTTTGKLRAFRLDNGEPIYITENNGKKQYVVKAVTGGKGSIYQGQGLATEITVASGHIIFGANTSATPNSKGTNGTLYAYSTPWAYSSNTTDLSGRLSIVSETTQGVPLKVYYTPTNIGTKNVTHTFSTRLYVNGIMVEERDFKRLNVGQETGIWVEVPSSIATKSAGTYEAKLVVDYYDQITEAVEDNNIITTTYKVRASTPKCPNGGTWNGTECVKEWTQTEIKHGARAILIR